MEVVVLERVREFVSALDIHLASRAGRLFDYLSMHGHDIEMPKSKSLGKGLFELRVTGSVQIRIFYCFNDGRAYLIHAIVKKRMSLPHAEITYARRIMNEICSR